MLDGDRGWRLLDRARTRLAASLLEALPEAVLASDSAQAIVYANARCERLFGYERDALVGRALAELLPGGVARAEAAAGRTTAQGRTKDGRDLRLELSASTLEVRGELLTVINLRESVAPVPQRDDLWRGEASFRTVLEGLPDAVVASRPDGSIAFVNARAEELFGYSTEELVGTQVDRLWPASLRKRYARNMQRMLSAGQALSFTREVRGLRRDGSEFPGEMTWGVVELESGPLMLAVGRDISERLEAEQRLRRHSAERAAVASLGERALAGGDPAQLAGQVAEAVAKTMEVGMVQVLELVSGGGGALRSLGAWSHSEDSTGALARASAAHANRALGSHGSAAFGLGDLGVEGPEAELARAGVRSGMAVAVRTGEELFGVLAAYAWREDAFESGDGAFLQAVANVLAAALARRRLDLRLRHQALHDPLTGLANRTLCDDRLELAVARSRRTGATIGVLYVDLNEFKEVNDSHGHAAGDEVLVALAHRLAEAVRPSDTVGRVGGDEFLVVCEDVNEQVALALGRRLAQVARQPIEAAGAEHRLSASIGVALSGSDPAERAALVRAADAAAYEAKRGAEDVKLARPDRADLAI